MPGMAFKPFLAVFVALLHVTNACTNMLVQKAASADGSNIIAYNADAANFYTTIYHYPAGVHNATATKKLWSWDYGVYLGEIPEASETYNVVGNVNEHGLIITESTFGGLLELECTGRDGIVDYGSLIWTTLQRAKTARQAIQTMSDLVNTYGYASTGESLSIADQDEMWYMELIGKGRKAKGAVWVARKVPEGYVTGHANQARITTFPLDDPDNCLYSPDVISFARDIGLYSGSDADFSFSDVYDPVTFEGARFCEARVWSYFSMFMGQAWSDQYLDYAMGYNLTNRMPLWIKPANKLSVENVMEAMRNHYEGTPLDATGKQFPDVGAESANMPIRSGSLVWSASQYPSSSFFNERTIAQSPTGWSIVCQSRPGVPREMAAVEWFGIDDSSTSVHFPLYGSSTRIPKGWDGPGPQDGATPPLMTFSLNSSFYVFNLVANYAYSRWEVIYPDVHAKILEKEQGYFNLISLTDNAILNTLASGDAAKAVEMMTRVGETLGESLLLEWFDFFGKLFVKYRDGFITTAAPHVPVCGCETDSADYKDEWYNRIATENGDRYKVPDESALNSPLIHRRAAIPKHELRALRIVNKAQN